MATAPPAFSDSEGWAAAAALLGGAVGVVGIRDHDQDLAGGQTTLLFFSLCLPVGEVSYDEDGAFSLDFTTV